MRRERMSGKERTLTSLRHREPDRIPLNIWMFRKDVRAAVVEKYGSLDAFHELLGIDVFMAVTPPPNRHNPEFVEELMNLDFEALVDNDFLDPDDASVYEGVLELVVGE